MADLLTAVYGVFAGGLCGALALVAAWNGFKGLIR
jgi:hypothetical protein